MRGARKSACLVALAAIAASAASAVAQEREPPQFGERLEVELVTVPVRVLDPAGHPVMGLGAGDFRLRVGGRELPIEAVDWLDAPAPETAGTGEGGAAGVTGSGGPGGPREPEAAPLEAGRLVVVFVQAALEPSRGPGLIQMLPKLRRQLEGLAPEDYVAVVSFDSHLKLRLDFTRDRSRLDPALADAVRLGGSPLPRYRRSPSLALDPREARRAASPERALELVARALEPLARPSTMIFLGWGLGERATIGTRMPPEYDAAVASLERSRTSVLVLDVTDAAFHSLELGLQRVADDTGGR